MTPKENNQPEKEEVELTDDALEQVSGGFNPQPDPPAKFRYEKVNQHLFQGSLPAVQDSLKKV